jgi:hypothetical protein
MKNDSITITLKENTNKVVYLDRKPADNESLPTGPFRKKDVEQRCSLLIFVPRNAISTLINVMTGEYGYSHLAVDCGEIDIPSGKRVMVESTYGPGVHHSFQDEYGKRHFVRIPLAKAGVDTDNFCDCVHSKLGEKFDDEEILTYGLVHNPGKQICSDLATVCLPEAILKDIALRHEKGILHSLSAVHPDADQNDIFHLFVSPNGFAEYFGAPRGKNLTGPDQLAEIKLQR